MIAIQADMKVAVCLLDMFGEEVMDSISLEHALRQLPLQSCQMSACIKQLTRN